MNQRLDELCKEMNSRNSGDLAGAVPQDSLGENTDVKSQKILSEDSAHYILIKSTENVQTKDQDQLEGGKALLANSMESLISSSCGCSRDRVNNVLPESLVAHKIWRVLCLLLDLNMLEWVQMGLQQMMMTTNMKTILNDDTEILHSYQPQSASF